MTRACVTRVFLAAGMSAALFACGGAAPQTGVDEDGHDDGMAGGDRAAIGGDDDRDGDNGDDGASETLVIPVGCVEGEFVAFYGNFHAHSSASDGDGTPAQAFAYARDTAGLDAFILTDHLEQLFWPLDDWTNCRAAADAANAPGTFVADCGYEWAGFAGVISTGHNNVFFRDELFDPSKLDFRDLYAMLANCTGCLGQFNHPGDEAGQTWNSFEYLAAADPALAMFEFNGAGDTWGLYFEALDSGWHLSPVRNQDNHDANWGTKNNDRTGLFMENLTRAAVQDAMQARRTFATTDADARVRLMAQERCWMGSRLSGASSLVLELEAHDAGTDTYSGAAIFGPGGTLVAQQDCGAANPCRARFSVTASGPTYWVGRVIQTDGDVLVSAPIWLTP